MSEQFHKYKYSVDSEKWNTDRNYFITADKVVKIMNTSETLTPEELALEMMGVSKEADNVQTIWSLKQINRAAKDYDDLETGYTREGPAIFVHKDHHWLAHVAHDLLSPDGELHYYIPYSQRISEGRKIPLDLQIAHGMGVLNFTRPNVQLMKWTPADYIVEDYHPDTVLDPSDGLTFRTLWLEHVLPTVETFYYETYLPLLEEHFSSPNDVYRRTISDS